MAKWPSWACQGHEGQVSYGRISGLSPSCLSGLRRLHPGRSVSHELTSCRSAASRWTDPVVLAPPGNGVGRALGRVAVVGTRPPWIWNSHAAWPRSLRVYRADGSSLSDMRNDDRVCLVHAGLPGPVVACQSDGVFDCPVDYSRLKLVICMRLAQETRRFSVG